MTTKVVEMVRGGMLRTYRQGKTDLRSVYSVRATYEQRKGKHRFEVRVTGKNGGHWSSAVENSIAKAGVLTEEQTAEICERIRKGVEEISQEEVDADDSI